MSIEPGMMSQPKNQIAHGGPLDGVYFGIPLGGFGAFASLLMACALGFMSFFLFTFLGIIGISIYNGLGHHVALDASYKFFALPAACLVLTLSLAFFGRLWLRRKFAGG